MELQTRVRGTLAGIIINQVYIMLANCKDVFATLYYIYYVNTFRDALLEMATS